MAQLIAVYKPPADPAAFDDYYHATHVPLAKTIPGLRRYDISSGPVAMPAGGLAPHLVAILHFDSLAAIDQALASPQGQAAAGDLGNFATGGVELMVFDTRPV